MYYLILPIIIISAPTPEITQLRPCVIFFKKHEEYLTFVAVVDISWKDVFAPLKFFQVTHNLQKKCIIWSSDQIIEMMSLYVGTK